MPSLPIRLGSALRRLLPALVFLLAAATPLLAQTTAAQPVQMGRFDFGKMWTFEYPPAEYFSETYGFEATPEWFERARLPALRIPGCSASFVSPNGLVVTNHHCARGSISRVSRDGESLLDDGFYATSLDEERRIPGYYADQLVHVEDITDELDAAGADRRQEAMGAVESRLLTRFGGSHPVRVQMVALYNGGRYSAYVFRRFTDVRLVAAVELNMGFFGGDPDNFTYPRYALDFTFLRVYDENGEPYRPTHWFTWGEGVHEGDPIFVIGNPGPTNRLQTVAQLEYQRDAFVPARERFFRTRVQALRDAYAEDPQQGERLGLRNQAFSLSNSLKAYTGRLAALQDPDIMARKRAAERDFAAAIASDATRNATFGRYLGEMATLQDEKREIAGASGAFYNLGHASYGSRVLRRAMRRVGLKQAEEMGVSPDTLAALRAALQRIGDHPGSLEEDLLRLRLEDLRLYLGDEDPLVRMVMDGRSPEGAAAALLAGPADRRERFASMLVERSDAYAERAGAIASRERALAAELGRARFDVYGTDMAPDATFSPRITDGVVQGYEFNGTLAPAFTTLFGVYDRYYSHDGHVDWQLPDRWLPVPEGLDLATPLNFASTADTYGGNSGSPAVTRDLAIVGLNFDRNIEGLSRDFIYLPERGRNVMVDVRAIRETLDKVYDADRIVLEILTGQLARTEAEADAIRR